MTKTPRKPAAGVRWHLEDIFESDVAVERELKSIADAVQSFEQAHRSNLEAEPTAAQLAAALTAYEEVAARLSRVGSYGYLIHTQDSQSPEVHRLYGRIKAAVASVSADLAWFDLAWRRLDDTIADPLLDDPLLTRYRYYLSQERAQRPFTLSLAEEQLLQRKAETGRQALEHLFDTIDSRVTGVVDGSVRTKHELLALMENPERSTRQAAYQALATGLAKESDLYAFTLNTILQDRIIAAELRGYKYPEQPTFLAYDVSAETVTSMLAAVEASFSIPEQFYRAKAQALSTTLHEWDRYSVLNPSLHRTYTWEEARDVVLRSFARFSPEFRDAADRFFAGGWIDAEMRPGKIGGAYCSYLSPADHPYVHLNFSGELSDVLTLAHELGHGIHGLMSRNQSYVNYQPSTATAEIASIFAEQLVFDELAKQMSGTELQNLRALKLQRAFSSIYRQVAFFRFEQAMYARRADSGPLSVDEFNRSYQNQLQAMFGRGLTLTDNHAIHWTHVLHFYKYNFYVFTYAFGNLLALSFFAKYREQPEDFVPRYLEALSLGGSVPPRAVTERVGAAIHAPEFWQTGLSLLEADVNQFVAAASRA